jgi:CPA2 family monovalent cation:H+ antiporter-2
MDEHGQELIGELAIVVALAVLAALLLDRFRLPPVIGFLVAGAVAGPDGLGFVSDTEDIELIAEIGVILLLFGIGLEFSLNRLRFIWRAVTIGGSLQVGGTVLATVLILSALDETPQRAVFFGLVVALSSTAIVLRALDRRGEIDAPHGRFIVGALIFQDLLVVPLTLFVPLLAGESDDVATELAIAVAKAVGVVAVAGIGARFLIPRFFRLVDQTGSREVFLLAVLTVGVGLAWGMSEFGLSFALGAFIAGLLLADTDYAHRAVTDVIPLRDTFTSIFFISLGMLFDPAVFIDEPVRVTLIVAGLLLGKGFIASMAAIAMRYPARASWEVGVNLAQFGEFGFIVLTLGLNAGLATDAEVELIVSAGVLSMLLSRLAMEFEPRLRAGEALLRPLERLLAAPGIDEPAPEHRGLTDHVVIVGYGIAGRLLARSLAEAGVRYLILELNADRVREARAAGAPIYYGDITSPEALTYAYAPYARAIVLLINDPAAARRAVASARAVCPVTPIFVRTRYLADSAELRALGANVVVAEELEGGTEMAAHVLHLAGLPELDVRTHVARALDQVAHPGATGENQHWLTAVDEPDAEFPVA